MPISTVTHVLVTCLTIFSLLAAPCVSLNAQTSVRRVALVIGNDSYVDSPLKNARNDARSMAGALRDLNFQVTDLYDANRDTITEALAGFERRLQKSDIALIYYAGHAVEVSQDNFIIPINLKSGAGAQSVRLNAISAYELMRVVRMAGFGAVILDACRTNPFLGSRGDSGLAPMRAEGVLFGMSTAPGKIADDSPNRQNSVYTSELVKLLHEPGMTMRTLFVRVKDNVYRASGGQQIPEYTDNAIGDVVLRATVQVAGRGDSARPVEPSTQPPRNTNPPSNPPERAQVPLSNIKPTESTAPVRKPTSTGMSNASGNFMFPVSPGAYIVEMQLQGFKSMIYGAVRVSGSSGVRFDVKMQVGSVTETITVPGAGRSGPGGMISGRVTDASGAVIPGVNISAYEIH